MRNWKRRRGMENAKDAHALSRTMHRLAKEDQQKKTHERAVARRAEAKKYGDKYPDILAERSRKKRAERSKERDGRIAVNKQKRINRKTVYRQEEQDRRHA